MARMTEGDAKVWDIVCEASPRAPPDPESQRNDSEPLEDRQAGGACCREAQAI
jgi:hypothetical protein